MKGNYGKVDQKYNKIRDTVLKRGDTEISNVESS